MRNLLVRSAAWLCCGVWLSTRLTIFVLTGTWLPDSTAQSLFRSEE
jgi:hypothetical protein